MPVYEDMLTDTEFSYTSIYQAYFITRLNTSITQIKYSHFEAHAAQEKTQPSEGYHLWQSVGTLYLFMIRCIHH